jgi:hypothetical protein
MKYDAAMLKMGTTSRRNISSEKLLDSSNVLHPTLDRITLTKAETRSLPFFDLLPAKATA